MPADGAIDPEAVLAVMDAAIAHGERCGWPSGYTPVRFIAHELGPWVGVDWMLSPDNWHPNSSALGKISAALGVLKARGLVARHERRPLYTMTAEGDAALAAIEGEADA